MDSQQVLYNKVISFNNIMALHKPFIVGMSFIIICIIWIGMLIQLSISFIIYEPIGYSFLRALIVSVVFTLLVGYLNGRYERDNK